MPKYEIYAGLSGGFNSLSFKGIEEHIDDESAWESAWEFACEEYDSIAGLYGTLSFEYFLEKYDGDEDYAHEMYADDRDSWINYKIIRVKE